MAGRKIPLTEARARLGVSKPTMSRLLRDGHFTLYENPLDKRQKLVDKEEVEALRQPRLARARDAQPEHQGGPNR